MDENNIKAGTRPVSHGTESRSCNDKVSVLFITMLVLFLCMLSACFTIEIYKLKSEVIALRSESSPAVQQQLGQSDVMRRSVNTSYYDTIKRLDASLNQLKSCCSRYSELYDRIDRVNASLTAEISDGYSALYDKIEQLKVNTSIENEMLTVNSCAALPHSSPSGYYLVTACNGSAVSVYCDMTRSCGGVTGGWTRVAYLNMTDSSQQCPGDLVQRTDSGKRTCGRQLAHSACSAPVIYSTAAVKQYSKVCGMIRAYQVASTDGFFPSHYGVGLDSYYVDGVSVTHGNPRRHIWTFASGLHEVVGSYSERFKCPCNHPGAPQPPAFVGNDYFCDTGSSGVFEPKFYGDNPLWDGAGCGSQSTCCSFNTPPWFYKQLPYPTTDDIEMRLCRSESGNNAEDTPIELVEIYVQ